MTIEQAIEHAEEVAQEKRYEYQECLAVHDKEEAMDCRKCGEEHEQLAAWLKELKERRKEPKIIRCDECEHSRDWGCELYCTKWVRYTSHNGYCHRGAERRIDGDKQSD